MTIPDQKDVADSLAGQGSMKGFNTWSGAANGAAKQVESWLKGRLGSRG